MKEPKQKAEELIGDFVQMMPTGIDKIGYKYKTQYDVCKCQAEYAAHIAKWSHKKNGKKWNYWLEVQNQIKIL